jgi:integrase/recombinase XerD
LSQWGSKLEHGDISQILAKHLKKAALPHKRPTTILRDTMAVHALEAGLDLRILAALLGHADLQGVKKYAAMDVRHLRAVHAKFHPAEQAKPRENAEK